MKPAELGLPALSPRSKSSGGYWFRPGRLARGACLKSWNKDEIDRAVAMCDRFAAAQQQPRTEVHLRTDKVSACQMIAEVLAASANTGVTCIGLVSASNEAGP
jgi:hypothetical protein